MTNIKGKLKKCTAGLLTAAVVAGGLPGGIAGKAKAALAEQYGSNATVYGGAYTDVVDDCIFTPTGSSTHLTVKVPSAMDRCSLSVYGLEPGLVVSAYHIIEANYNRLGFTGWTECAYPAGIVKFDSFHNTAENVSQVVAVDNFKYIEQNGTKTNTASATTTANPDYNKGLVIKSSDITALYAAGLTGVKSSSTTPVTNGYEKIELRYDATTGEYYTNDAEAGTYLVVVENTNTYSEYFYNPMIISNDYSSAGNALSLSNVTAIREDVEWDPKTQGEKPPFAYSSYHDDAQYGYGVAARGVDTDGNNSYKDYSFVISGSGSTATNKKTGTYDTSDTVESHTAGQYNNTDTYPAREDVVYHRDVEANGKVYAVTDGNQGVSPMTDVKTMALLGRAYAKKSSIGFEKNIVYTSTDGFPDKPVQLNTNTAANTRVTNALAATDTFYYSKYDDISEGQTVTFDIMTNIPEIIAGNDKDDYYFKVTDYQCAGLDPVTAGNVEVYAGFSSEVEAEKIALDIVKPANKLTAGSNTYSFEASGASKEKNTFTVTFANDYILNPGNVNKKIVIRYSTTVNDNASLGLIGNRNAAEVDFYAGHEVYKADYTMHYTFKPTIAKVGENGFISWSGDVTLSDKNTTDYAGTEQAAAVDTPLPGAEFKLIRIGSRDGKTGEGFTNNLQTASNIHYEDKCDSWTLTSDANGFLQFDTDFNGIDEGLYAIYETKAPAGYTINDRVYYIEINPDYNETLKQFTGINQMKAKTWVMAEESEGFLKPTSAYTPQISINGDGYSTPAFNANTSEIYFPVNGSLHVDEKFYHSNGSYYGHIEGDWSYGDFHFTYVNNTYPTHDIAIGVMLSGGAYNGKVKVEGDYTKLDGYNWTDYSWMEGSTDPKGVIRQSGGNMYLTFIFDGGPKGTGAGPMNVPIDHWFRITYEIDVPEKPVPLIESYTVKEYNSRTKGTTDATVNAQDGTGYVSETLYSWNSGNTARVISEVSGDGVLAIPNTKLTKLPTTGGIGTLVFTAGGLVLMGAALAVLKKKKTNEEDEDTEDEEDT